MIFFLYRQVLSSLLSPCNLYFTVVIFIVSEYIAEKLLPQRKLFFARRGREHGKSQHQPKQNN